MTVDPGLAVAALTAAFAAGTAVALMRSKASKLQLARVHGIAARALRTALKAHARLDELEAQTGTRTALRPDAADLEA